MMQRSRQVSHVERQDRNACACRIIGGYFEFTIRIDEEDRKANSSNRRMPQNLPEFRMTIKDIIGQ